MAKVSSQSNRVTSLLSRAVSLVKRGVQNPSKVPNYLGQVYNKRKLDFEYELYRRRNSIPSQRSRIHRFLEEDEFVLVILDACRYDAFEELHSEYLSGSLSRAWSSGNWTQKWMANTWKDTYDFTYISTTPYTFDYAHREYSSTFTPSEHFEEVIDVIGKEWNPVLSTTPAEPVTDIALQHLADADQKRAVVHYMQPHTPYIGENMILQWDLPESKIDELLETIGEHETAQSADGDPKINEESLTLTELVRRDIDYRQERQLKRENYETIDTQLNEGKITKSQLRTAYEDNLEYVLSEVQRLVEHLDCPVVVSADHGEHLGDHFDELPRLKHPDRTHPILREVPWFVVDDDSKAQSELAEIDPETEHEPDAEEEPDQETIERRLEALGYKE